MPTRADWLLMPRVSGTSIRSLLSEDLATAIANGLKSLPAANGTDILFMGATGAPALSASDGTRSHTSAYGGRIGTCSALLRKA